MFYSSETPSHPEAGGVDIYHSLAMQILSQPVSVAHPGLEGSHTIQCWPCFAELLVPAHALPIAGVERIRMVLDDILHSVKRPDELMAKGIFGAAVRESEGKL